MKKIITIFLSLSLSLGLITNVNASNKREDKIEQQNAINIYLSENASDHQIAKSIMIFEKYSVSKPRMLYYLGLANIETKTKLITLEKEIGYDYIEQAAVLGDPEAIYKIAMIKMTEGNLKDGIKGLKKASLQNNANAQYTLGKMYYQGNGVPLNKKNGFTLIEKSAKNKFPDAQYDLAKIYFSQKNQKIQKAGIYWLKQSVKSNKIEACSDLYKIYNSGLLVEKNIFLHKKYLSCSAENKDEEAMLLLASYYETGKYFKKNEATSHIWHGKLKAMKNETGTFKHSIFILKNTPRDKDKTKIAIQGLNTISEKNMDAAMLLGEIYKNGLYKTPISNKKAIKAFENAKRMGNNNAAKEIILLLNQ